MGKNRRSSYSRFGEIRKLSDIQLDVSQASYVLVVQNRISDLIHEVDSTRCALHLVQLHHPPPPSSGRKPRCQPSAFVLLPCRVPVCQQTLYIRLQNRPRVFPLLSSSSWLTLSYLLDVCSDLCKQGFLGFCTFPPASL